MNEWMWVQVHEDSSGLCDDKICKKKLRSLRFHLDQQITTLFI